MIRGITMYLNGSEVEYTDNSVGSYEGMVNENVETRIASDDGVTTMAPADFNISDIVLFSRALSGFEAVYIDWLQQRHCGWRFFV